MKVWTKRLAAAGLAAQKTGRAGRFKRLAVIVPVLLAAIAVTGAVAAPVRASVPARVPVRGWSFAPSPNPVIPTGQLDWVSCPAANSCMAVGTYVNASGAGVVLSERWDGSAWRLVPIPSPSGAAFSQMLGVSCVSPSSCEAVGGTATRSGAFRAMAERWDGTRWRVQSAPTPAGGGYLVGVSCTSVSACTAVGGPPSGTPGKALVERWDGSKWQIQPAPSPAGYFLNGVACTSSSACTAVGGSLTGAGTLAEAWDGTSWSIRPTPNPSQGGGVLDSVACTSSSACIAVGGSNAGNLAEAWDGTSWAIQPAPTPAGAQFAFLNTIACTSASACTATGAYVSASGAFLSQAERWDGTSWAIQPTPRLAGGVMTALYGVACTSAAGCLAVGFSIPNGFNNSSPATLAERWDGTSWRVQRTPNPPGAAAGNLQGASCVSGSDCVAVGNTSNSRGVALPTAQRWDGRSWHIQATPSPSDGGILVGVSCPRRSTCLAVGGHGNPNIATPPGTLAELWNGTRWRILRTPNPPGDGWTLGAVSCTSPTACTATGGRLVSPGKPTGTLAERWNGRRWSIQPTPSLPGKAIKLLTGVVCTSASSCLAVGGEFDPATGNNLGTLAERWNGRRWQIVPTVSPAPRGGGAFLNGVACSSADACTAVGNITPVKTLAERWNGRRWQVQATPNPAGGQNIFLAGVACPARTVCTAFGLNLTGSGPRTLAERWSGGSWRIQPTPPLAAYDIGFPGVACPTASACFAVASYANDLTSVTLVERWNGSGKFARPAASQPAPPGGLLYACTRARLPASVPIDGRIQAAPWFRFRASSVLSRTGSPWLARLPGCEGV